MRNKVLKAIFGLTLFFWFGSASGIDLPSNREEIVFAITSLLLLWFFAANWRRWTHHA